MIDVSVSYVTNATTVLGESCSSGSLETVVADARKLAEIARGWPFCGPQYTQVVDGALRTAADKVGSESFTIVHKPEKRAS